MNKLKALFIKHPKFRKCFDMIDEKINILGVFYWLLIGGFISLFVILLYSQLPNDLKKPVSVIVGTIMTSLAIPLVLENINKRYETRWNQFEKNYDDYVEFAEVLFEVFEHRNENECGKQIKNLSEYIQNKYGYMCLNYSAELIRNIISLKKECDYFKEKEAVGSLENIIYYSEKCLHRIRKQGHIDGKIYLNNYMIKSNVKNDDYGTPKPKKSER